MEPGTLSIVATPIGNLEDITLRALRVLKEADMIFCEDTRVISKLLARYEIEKSLSRADENKEDVAAKKALELLEAGRRVVFVSDAGTPGISDPGTRFVALIREANPEIKIEAIPGPSALTAALSIAGVSAPEFTFLGFLPHKKGRQTLFKEIGESERVVVFYESPHRIEKALESLVGVLAPARRVVVCRELTKMFESVVAGSAAEVAAYFAVHQDEVRGEIVVIVAPE